MIKSYKDLTVHKEAFSLAMDIYWRTRKFPQEEIYSLTSQIVRSSRSVIANISEGWGKRMYEAVFKQQLVNALGSNSETQDWLDYAHACKYMEEKEYSEFLERNNKVGRMLTKLYQNWKSYE
ncbi:MAG: diversity-generating retroelement protein bAvd family protein [Flavobacteriaceae bacterium]|nr:diversity-generating retroelement protein bAvd family protein [Flavobacteriaceae bacterium]|tara:strand:+ start:5886 stop:6251 length:366 start_codon:yes stop_codon:yes gene_type:complete